jgi:exodeoxyribonuclease VII small subunit
MATNASGEFEKALERLEEIVGKLERENPSLDESVALFREGKDLAQKCEELLSGAQAAIEGVQRGVDANAPVATSPNAPNARGATSGSSLFDGANGPGR